MVANADFLPFITFRRSQHNSAADSRSALPESPGKFSSMCLPPSRMPAAEVSSSTSWNMPLLRSPQTVARPVVNDPRAMALAHLNPMGPISHMSTAPTRALSRWSAQTGASYRADAPVSQNRRADSITRSRNVKQSFRKSL